MPTRSLVTLVSLILGIAGLLGCPKNAAPPGAPKGQQAPPTDVGGIPKGAPLTAEGTLDKEALKTLAWMENAMAYSADGTDFRWGEALPDGGPAMAQTPPYDPAIAYPDLAIQPKELLTPMVVREEPATPPEKRAPSTVEPPVRGAGEAPKEPVAHERPVVTDVDPAKEWAPVPIPAGPFKVKTRMFTYHGDGLNVGGIGAVPEGTGLFPMVIAIHGYIPADRYTVDSLRREAEFLASRGLVVLVPDLRNYGSSQKDEANEEIRRLGYLRDVLNMVQVVRLGQVPEGDPTQVALLGWGHGGSLALKAAVLVRPIGVISISGTGLQEALDHDLFKEYMAPEAAAGMDALYGDPATSAEWYSKMSLGSFVDKLQCPVALIHGERDPIAPVEWPRAIMTILTPVGLPVQSNTFPRVGHAFYGEDWVGMMESVWNFLKPLVTPAQPLTPAAAAPPG